MLGARHVLAAVYALAVHAVGAEHVLGARHVLAAVHMLIVLPHNIHWEELTGSRSQTPKLMGTRSPLRSQTVVQLLPPADAPLPHLQRPHTSIGVAAGGFCSPPPPYTPMQTEKHVRATAQYHRKPAHRYDVAMAACVKPHKYGGLRTAHNAG